MRTIKITLAPGAPITPLRIACENGRIVNLLGETGRTQDEERVALFGLADGVIDLAWFIWSHYLALLVEVDGDEAELYLKSPDGEAAVAVRDLTRKPEKVDVVRSVLHLSLPPEEPELTAAITPTSAVAGTRQSFVLTLTVGACGIAEGGGVMVLTPVTAWPAPDCSDGIVSLESDSGAILGLSALPDAYSTRGPRLILTVRGATLNPGDTIRLRYTGENGGVRVQTYDTPNVFFRVLADETADGNFAPVPLARTPSVAIVPGPAHRLRLACPSVAQAGVDFDARVVVLDKCYNPIAEPFNGTCRISCDDETLGEGEFSEERQPFVVEGLRLDEPGLHIVRAKANSLPEVCLPVLVTEETPQENVYWGAIHGHSNVSDGEDAPDDYYAYGRDVGLVDVCALTDHAWEIALHHRNAGMGRFAGIVDVARRFHEDGRFVTIPAYEWMGPDGHVNVYYLEDDPQAPVYVDAILDWVECKSLGALLEKYKGTDALVLPHASHGMRWNYFDPDLEPVVEIVSMWGVSEYECVNPEGAQAGLQQGYRFGFIGGSDGHHGRPGQTGNLSRYKMLNAREGLAAFRATDLTRGSIFEALRARRTYATTGERIYLDFSINETPMGGQLTLPPGEALMIEARVGGTAPLEHIECIRNGEAAHSKQCDGFVETVRWENTAPSSAGATDYYYLRVTQSDDKMAWSSPIWVESIR